MGTTTQIDSVTRMTAAVRALRGYFTFLGRNDITSYSIGSLSTKTADFESLSTANQGTDDGASTEAGVIDQDVIDNIMDVLVDNTEGGFFLYDILTEESLITKFDIDVEASGAQYDGIENFVIIHTEATDVEGASNIAFVGEDNLSLVCREEITSQSDTAGDENIEFAMPPVNEAGFIKSPNRYTSPSFGVIEFPNLQFGLPTRNTNAVALFINSLPAHELSRCVPFLDIRFQSVTPPIIGERVKQLSILRFLGMSSDDDPNDKIGMRDALPLAQARDFEALVMVNANPTFDMLDSTISNAGMELFTSPQTLVNADINSKDSDGENAFGGSGGTVLDPFKPLATLDKLTVSISGTGQDLIGNKTASLSFTLHDRSRMKDIAPILAADLFGITSLVIEYGWSHPDGSFASDNALGQLINSMRQRGTYNVVASNFTILPDGQVRVTVDLAARGAQDAKITPIGTGNYVPLGIFRPMLINYLAKRLSQETSSDRNELRDIRKKITLQMNNINSPSNVVSRDVFNSFLELIKPQHSPDGELIQPDIADLTDIVEKLIGSDGTEGDASDSDAWLSKTVTQRLDAMKAPLTEDGEEVETIYDPWIQDTLPGSIDERVASLEHDIAPGGDYVSVGKIFSQFVGVPLSASAQYDEVQLIFYRFNGQAAAARQYRSIAQFLVPYLPFRIWMTAYITRSPGMSVSGFIEAFCNKWIHNNASINYGLDQFYQKKADITENESMEGEEKQRWSKVIGMAQEAALRLMYEEDGLGGDAVFTPPQINVFFESVPAQVVSEGGNGPTIERNDAKMILRVHIYDQKSTPHGDALFLIAAMSDGEIATKLKGAAQAAPQVASALGESVIPNGQFKGLLEQAIANALISPASESNDTNYEAYITNISASEIKGLIKSTVPSLTFGSECNALKSMNLTSSTGGLLGDVLLLNTLLETADPSQGAGASLDLEPMQVIPASIRVDLVGCPLIEHGQQFFIDVGTGTTADNLYISADVSHTIVPGDFTTSFGLTFCSNGTVSTFRKVLAASLPRLKDLSSDSNSN